MKLQLPIAQRTLLRPKLFLFLFFLLFVLAVASVALATPEQETTLAPKDLCYAFQHGQDIWTVCQGRRERIRIPHGVSGFAISTDGLYLAYFTDKPSANKGASPHQDLILVSLQEGFRTFRKEQRVVVQNLYGTCGTILKDDIERTAMIDLLGRVAEKLPPHGFFQCSSDLRVIVRWDGPGAKDVGDSTVTLDGKELERLPKVGTSFSISPDGRHLIYSQAQLTTAGIKSQTCFGEPGGQPSCTPNPPGNRGVHSISDSGEVLSFVELDTFCHGLACIGIQYWRPDTSKREILEKDNSYEGQWISPQTAARLHEWASTLSSPPATKPK